MRQKRAKAYRKQMLVYNHTFKFREPYQVIVDDQLVLKCDSAKYDLAKGLARTIQAEVKPMITQCCMQALYKENNQSAIALARTFERRRCNHPPSEALAPHECIKSVVLVNGENKHRYVVASENDKLRWSLRKVAGIPLIYMNRSVMVMEPLSKASALVNSKTERSKLTGGLNDARGGVVVDKKSQQTDDGAEKTQTKKRKGPKEPNPLSIKKKKTSADNKDNGDGDKKRKRKRKHKKHNEDGEGGDDANEDDGEAESTKSGEDSGNDQSDDE